MQPSYPTNGSTLARTLISRATGIGQRVTHYGLDDPSQRMYNLNGNLDLFLNCNNNNQELSDHIPMMGKPVFFMSHKWSENQMANTEGGKINGVLRLARNPGDQILRNQFRWVGSKQCQSRKDLSNIPDKCKLTKGHSVCRSLNVEKYLNSHSFWNNFDESTPQAIWHYEHFSSKAHALSSWFLKRMTKH